MINRIYMYSYNNTLLTYCRWLLVFSTTTTSYYFERTAVNL